MKSTPANISSDLELAIEAARRAGAVIAEHYAKTKTISVKPDGKGLVTETDNAAECMIIDLFQANSSYAIISEESAPYNPKSGRSWIIDPLDGTSNFARQIPLFVTSIGLFEDREAILGVIYNPMTGECFYAEKGKGAYLNGQPLHVSETTDPEATVLFLNHGSHPIDKQRYAQLSERFIGQYSLRALGATALELTYLARGCAEGFLCSGDELWDYAAGIVLVEEAGGKVSDWKGRHWDRHNAFLLASNGRLHQKVLQEIGDLQDNELLHDFGNN